MNHSALSFNIQEMKGWLGFFFSTLFLTAPCLAQDLTGIWEGEASNLPKMDISLVGMAIDKPVGRHLTGCLYQEFEYGKYFVTYHLTGKQSTKMLVVEFDGVLKDHHPDIPNFQWDAASIAFTYDEREEKLVGRNLTGKYTRSRDYTFTLYRVKLKSKPTVPIAVPTTLRVSGRDVRWYADPKLEHLIARGNAFSTRLYRNTTYYILQGVFPARKNSAKAITIQVAPGRQKPKTARQTLPAPAATPVVLPTVLFYTGTATLMPTAAPALSQLATTLKTHLNIRLQIAGHTDQVGESIKNQLLSKQRAAAVKMFLTQAGVAPDRLETIGYGDTRSLFPTPNARNRRVEITRIR